LQAGEDFKGQLLEVETHLLLEDDPVSEADAKISFTPESTSFVFYGGCLLMIHVDGLCVVGRMSILLC